jgi:CRISPR-associated protein Csd1
MILQALKDYGERNAPVAQDGTVADAFTDDVTFHWLLEIDEQGNFLNLHYRGEEQRDEKGKKLPDRFAPLNNVPKEVFNSRSSGRNPQFLADNLEYFFGVSSSKLGPKNRNSHHELVIEFARAYPSDARAIAARKFFEKLRAGSISVVWDKDAPRGKEKLIVKARNVERRFAAKNPKERIALCLSTDNFQPVFQTCRNLQVFWSKHFQSINAERQNRGAAPNRPCICCGASKPTVDTFDQFDGLPGGKTYLISYGKDAFHSYGFEDGENASLCFDCMKAIIRGMKLLLQGTSTHKLIRYGKPKADETEKVGPVMFAFWSKEPARFDFGKVSDAEPEEVKKLLESVRRGIPQEIAAIKFYILGFSRSSRLRTLVRHWSESNAKEVEENLAAWFTDLHDRFADYGTNYKPFAFIRLCQTTIRQPDKQGDEWKFPPAVSTGLFLSAFLGKRVPPPVLQMLVNRVRIIPQTDCDPQKPFADYKLKPARMALLRLTLNRLMNTTQQKFDVGLDVSRQEPEYHCGRLLAICDDAMRWATSGERGKPGRSTVADRYMGSASSAPSSVLPVVYRNSRHHLNKLKRDMPAKSTQLEKLLDETLSKLKSYPVTLTPQKAGVFILGFHHQRQYFFLVSRFGKLARQKNQGDLLPEDEKELDALSDFVQRTCFDVALLADLPDEEAPEAPEIEKE